MDEPTSDNPSRVTALERLSWRLLIPLAIGASLAPWPIGPEPHLVEKLRWLIDGTLTRPLDIFDLVFHATPGVLVLSKGLVAWYAGRSGDGASSSSTSPRDSEPS